MKMNKLKRNKKTFIVIGVVIVVIGSLIFANNIFWYQIYGENYAPADYISNEGYEIRFPASPKSYVDVATIQEKQVPYSRTMVIMKDSSAYEVNYLHYSLDNIVVNDEYIKDLIVGVKKYQYIREFVEVQELENIKGVIRYAVTYKIPVIRKLNVVFDPMYENFWVIESSCTKETCNKDNLSQFLESFKLTYLDEDQALTEFYSNLESENVNLQNQLTNNNQSYQSQISKLKSEIQSLGTAPSSNSYTKAEASSFWSQYTVKLSCDFAGEFVAEGSGLLIDDGVITNAHVFTEEVSGVLYGPDYCTVSSPKLSGSVTVEFDPDDYLTVDGVDFGEILISNPTSQMRGLMDDSVLDKMCDPQNVAIGDEMIVLGYPYTGSTQSITVTDGIVSGFENNFYVTSTKIEHGNSGGVAVLIKDNCYLGVPTFVASGEFESLGRILDVYSFFYY